MKIYFDGGCRPGGLTLAVVIAGGGEILRNPDIGAAPPTSMTAEWLALLHAAELAIARGIAGPVLIGDAAAVIAQARGEIRCPPPHRAHLAAFRAMAPDLGGFRLRWTKRTQNLAGIALARATQLT